MNGGQVVLDTVAQGSDSGYSLFGADDEQITGPVVFVAHDAGEWAAFWERHARLVSPPLPVPAIDFGTNAVVAVVDVIHSHVRTTEVVEITSEDGALVVRAVRPASPDFQWPALSQPYHFVAIEGAGWNVADLELTEE
jgi:hypothetical protein